MFLKVIYFCFGTFLWLTTVPLNFRLFLLIALPDISLIFSTLFPMTKLATLILGNFKNYFFNFLCDWLQIIHSFYALLKMIFGYLIILTICYEVWNKNEVIEKCPHPCLIWPHKEAIKRPFTHTYNADVYQYWGIRHLTKKSWRLVVTPFLVNWHIFFHKFLLDELLSWPFWTGTTSYIAQNNVIQVYRKW